MSDAYLGEIRVFAGTYAPVGWLLCQGQLLQIAQYQALFSIVGTTYGGDGRTTFGLPNFSGRAPVGTGKAPIVSAAFVAGQQAGVAVATVLSANMPAHTHSMGATTQKATTHIPGPTTLLAAVEDAAGSPVNIYGETNNSSTPLNITLSPQSTTVAGASLPVDVQNPYLTLSLIICTEGFYPTQS
ncbi:phage tail protein [Pantoea sp. Ap-967]|uniref:phage tail protein n=1 Tax=Pantoea sp. Ap-967 TaxID=2608362 RepID=UPI001423A137|nr:tail fiber protein [Pantoea sp. Ap-967]NIE74163.1 phage tail protein [Pantoea sp. Ap-967]